MKEYYCLSCSHCFESEPEHSDHCPKCGSEDVLEDVIGSGWDEEVDGFFEGDFPNSPSAHDEYED